MEICTLKTRGTYSAHAATSQRSHKSQCGTIHDPPKALLPGYRNITGPMSLNSSTPGGSPPLHRRWHRRNISPQEVGSETQNYQLHYQKKHWHSSHFRCAGVIARTISTGSSTCSGGDLIHQGLEGTFHPFPTPQSDIDLSSHECLVDHIISNEAKADTWWSHTVHDDTYQNIYCMIISIGT